LLGVVHVQTHPHDPQKCFNSSGTILKSLHSFEMS
jgi:hypothetical protein